MADEFDPQADHSVQEWKQAYMAELAKYTQLKKAVQDAEDKASELELEVKYGKAEPEAAAEPTLACYYAKGPTNGYSGNCACTGGLSLIE